MKSEAEAILQTAQIMGPAFVQAVEIILNCHGRLCITGMGKAGLVGHKIQATFASVGTLSYSLHPAEALHGDLGMVDQNDVVLALSKSGSSEISALLPMLKKLGCKIILITAKKISAAAEYADCLLLLGTTDEACPLGLAPSSSTTAMLALGDALALAVMEQRNFTAEHYALNHPGGALGRSLMLVSEMMRTGDNCPAVSPQASLADCFAAMNKAPLRAGAVCVIEQDHKLLGIITQGDIFRRLMNGQATLQSTASDFMTAHPKQLAVDIRVVDALKIVKQYRLDELPVVDNQGILQGLVDIQDLISEGFEI